MKLTVLVDTDGLPSVPCSFALAFAFLAASRFFLESDTISAEWAQLVWIVRWNLLYKIASSSPLPTRTREAAGPGTWQEYANIKFCQWLKVLQGLESGVRPLYSNHHHALHSSIGTPCICLVVSSHHRDLNLKLQALCKRRRNCSLYVRRIQRFL